MHPSLAKTAVLVLAAAAGCGAPGPIEGADLARLKADVAAARAGRVVISTVGPPALAAGGPGAGAVMPYESQGKRLADFPLYDAYFKVAFTVVDELRALGLDAALAPRIWKVRSEAVAFETRGLDGRTVEVNLTRLGAQEDIQQLWKLGPAEQRDVLVSKIVLGSARSGLPPAIRGRPKITPREIRELYFGAEDDPRLAHALDVEALEVDALAEEGTFGARRVGRAALRFRGLGLEREVRCAAEAEGTGVKREKGGPGFALQIGADDPLELAIRGCVRAFVADALPRLRRPGL